MIIPKDLNLKNMNRKTAPSVELYYMYDYVHQALKMSSDEVLISTPVAVFLQ